MLIDVDVIDSQEADEDSSIDRDVVASDEEGGGVLVVACVTEEV